MSYDDKDLIPVRSESELRAGMTVVRKGCNQCGGATHVEILARRCAHGGWCSGCGDARAAWEIANGDCRPGGCYCVVIALGKVFRLDTGIDEEADMDRQLADNLHARSRFLARLTR